LNKVVITAVNQTTNAVHATLLTQTFSSVTSATIAGFTSSILPNTLTLIVSIYCELSSADAFVTSRISILIERSVVSSTTTTIAGNYKPTQLVHSVLRNKVINYYDSSKALVKSFTTVNSGTQAGFMQYVLGFPTWWVNFSSEPICFTATAEDNSTYIVFTLGSTITVNVSPTPVTLSNSSARFLALIKYRDGQPEWAVKVSAVPTTGSPELFVLSGLRADYRGVYLYGSHKCTDNPFIAYSTDVTELVVDAAPLNNPATGLPNGFHSFVVMYSPTGVVLSRTKLDSNNLGCLKSLRIDSAENFSYVAGNGLSNASDSVLTVTAFNDNVLSVPKNLSFLLKIQNKEPVPSGSDWWVSIGPNLTNEILDVTTDLNGVHVLLRSAKTTVLFDANVSTTNQTTISNTSAEVTATSTTDITVGSTTGFPSSGIIYIGTEGISYTAKTSTKFTGTISRGVKGTASAHASGSFIFEYPSLGSDSDLNNYLYLLKYDTNGVFQSAIQFSSDGFVYTNLTDASTILSDGLGNLFVNIKSNSSITVIQNGLSTLLENKFVNAASIFLLKLTPGNTVIPFANISNSTEILPMVYANQRFYVQFSFVGETLLKYSADATATISVGTTGYSGNATFSFGPSFSPTLEGFSQILS
jgi:hypothetical protein